MTITRLTIEGVQKGNCLFAGLAIYQGLREDIIFCSNRSFWNSTTTNDTNHTLSPSNDMSLVSYSIKNFTSLATSLIFTLSTCSGVTINPCEYEVYCGSDTSKFPLCTTYLNSLTTVNAQFKKTIKNIIRYESLHKIFYLMADLILLKQKTNSCLQIYFSSSVKARKQNIFEDRYHQSFLAVKCSVIIFPEIESLRYQKENWVLYTTYLGNLGKTSQLERFLVSGKGKNIVNYFDNFTQKQETSDDIIKEENNFHNGYKKLIQDGVTSRVGVLSGIYHHNGIKLNKISLDLK